MYLNCFISTVDSHKSTLEFFLTQEKPYSSV